MRFLAKRSSALAALVLGIFLVIGAEAVWAFSKEDMMALGVQLKDEELEQCRGGYSVFYFGVHFTGYLDTLGDLSGGLTFEGNITKDPSTQLPIPGNSVAEVTGNGATIQAYVGNFHGASGIFQIVQSPGSFNMIQNNLLVQITMINVASDAALSQLRSFLPW